MATSIDTSYEDQPISAADFYRARLEKHARLEKERKAADDQAELLDKEEPAYRVTISEEALKKAGLLKDTQETPDGKNASSDKDTVEIEELKRQDREVRAHEQAHVMAGGSLVRGSASFDYKSGPDGILYAVGGEVSIDSSTIDGDPQATIRKMEQVQKAALAPAQPSGQDRAVAAAAMNAEMNARRQLTEQQFKKA